jgi:DNA-binding MarR family transcriptional regulator
VQELVDAGYLRRGADQGDRRSEKVARTLKDPILR